jgi:hypothetical protein
MNTNHFYVKNGRLILEWTHSELPPRTFPGGGAITPGEMVCSGGTIDITEHIEQIVIKAIRNEAPPL